MAGLIMLASGIIVLALVLYLEIKNHRKERGQLISRIMARNFSEYAQGQKIIEEINAKPKTEQAEDVAIQAWEEAEIERQKEIKDGGRIPV